jgi:tRNA-splicing ligase RtcB
MDLKQIEKITTYEWEISRSVQPWMRVPVRIFSDEIMLKAALQDRSLDQAVNAASLPGLVGSVCVMPDVHQGYGFPIGGVAATDVQEGVISPGGIGYDINCGVRLMASDLPRRAAEHLLEDFTRLLYQACPSGVGEKGIVQVQAKELRRICEQGSGWALKNGFADRDDIETSEDGGCIAGADWAAVSRRASERGAEQIGSLGSGNHFIEVDCVEQVFDEQAAAVMGLHKGSIAIQLHSGSRGFGHQVCTDFVHQFQAVAAKYHIQLPDRELVCAPLNSAEGRAYLAAMRASANYAFCNRQVLAFAVRQTFEDCFPGHHLRNVYDLAHNIGKIETHQIGGQSVRVCVHRKGATRAFGPGHPDLPQQYQKIGQPVLVPGSMGTSSWVLAGTESAMVKSFGSCSHGAGRVLSRTQAKKEVNGGQLREELAARGIFVQAGSLRGLAEEAPRAYKNIDRVIECIEGAGLGRSVARLVPLAVIKG